MERYEILYNGSTPFLVTVNKDIKTTYVYCRNPYYDKTNTNYTKYNTVPILTYKYDDIFIGDHNDNIKDWGHKSLGNNILVGLGHNIYVNIGGYDICVFKSLAKITHYFSPIGNNDVPYPYFVDTLGNFYCISSDIIIKEYYINTKKNINKNMCGHWICDINKPFKYKHYYYDLNGEFLSFDKNYSNNTRSFRVTYDNNPEKNWDDFIIRRNIHSYRDSENNVHKLTKKFYCKLMKHYAKYKKIEFFNHTPIIKRGFCGEYCNIIKRPDRLGIIKMFMYINYFLKKNNIIIDKYIIKYIIKNYDNYLNNINILSQCSQAIDYLKDTNTELYMYSLIKYGDAIKYILNNENIKLRDILLAINNDPFVIRRICKLKTKLNITDNILYNLCIVAIKKNYDVIKYIDGTCMDSMMFKDLIMFSIKINGEAILNFYDEDEDDLIGYKKDIITQEMCNIAVYNGLLHINRIPVEFRQKWMDDIILMNNPWYIKDMNEPTKEQWLYAINKDSDLFRYIPQNIKLEICSKIVKKHQK